MKTIAPIIILVCAFRSDAQLWPEVRKVSFEEVANHYNTVTAKDELIAFVSGCEISFATEGRIPYPVEINLRKPVELEKRNLKVYCWDAAARRWKKACFSTEIVDENGQPFVRFATDIPGLYALMKTDIPQGKCEMILPKGFNAGKWKYAEYDTGIVAEGSCNEGKMVIRKTFVVPDASLYFFKSGKRDTEQYIPHVGQWYSSLWADVSTPSQTYLPDTQNWQHNEHEIISKK